MMRKRQKRPGIQTTLPDHLIFLILTFIPVVETRLLNKTCQLFTRPTFLRTCFATVFDSYWNAMLQTKDEFDYIHKEIMSLWWADLMHSDIWKQFPDLVDELKKG